MRADSHVYTDLKDYNTLFRLLWSPLRNCIIAYLQIPNVLLTYIWWNLCFYRFNCKRIHAPKCFVWENLISEIGTTLFKYLLLNTFWFLFFFENLSSSVSKDVYNTLYMYIKIYLSIITINCEYWMDTYLKHFSVALHNECQAKL